MALLLLFSLSSKLSFSQTKNFDSKLTSTTTGKIINFTQVNRSFSLNVEGKTFKPVIKNGEQNYLTVDGRVLQYLLVPFPEKVDYLNFTEKKKQDFLLDYEGYEMDYLKKTLKVDNLNEHLKYETLNGRLFLFWVYDMPKNVSKDQSVKQQCYLITVCFDHMLVLNSPAEKDWTETHDFLTKVGSSLKMMGQ